MKLNKRESSPSSSPIRKSTANKDGKKERNAKKVAYDILYDSSGGHQYFNDIDNLDDYNDDMLPHKHDDAIFDPPPISRETGGDLAPPWLGLHLEQQTVMMAQWTTERRAMADENDRLRRLLSEAEERIRELELIEASLQGSSGSGSNMSPAASEGRGNEHRRSGTDSGSVCSVATTVLAGTNAKYPCPKGIKSNGTEKSIGARRTAERCKEGLGCYGGVASKQKKKKKRLFCVNGLARSRDDGTVTRGGRSRSYSPRRNDRSNKRSTHRSRVTRVEEEAPEDIDTYSSSGADDDETAGISDHTDSPPATPQRTRARSLSPLPCSSPSSRNSPQRQPESPISNYVDHADPQGKNNRGNVNIENKQHRRTNSSPPRNKIQGWKGADAPSRPSKSLVEKKKTQMIYSTNPRKIVLSKVAGIKSRSSNGVSKDAGNKKREAVPARTDIEVIAAKSKSNKYRRNTILLYGRNHVDEDDGEPLIEI